MTPISVRAKFRVSSITRRQNTAWIDNKPVEQETQTIELYPVSGTSEENKKFFAATPSGKIELGIVRLESAGLFQLNAEYYVDFSPAS